MLAEFTHGTRSSFPSELNYRRLRHAIPFHENVAQVPWVLRLQSVEGKCHDAGILMIDAAPGQD